jgi:hypothetical protein
LCSEYVFGDSRCDRGGGLLELSCQFGFGDGERCDRVVCVWSWFYRPERGSMLFVCCWEVQGGKRDGDLYRLLGRELLRGAGGKQFRELPELPGQLELGGGELFNYIMRVQRRSEWSQWRTVFVVCSGQV